jgi:hypothetical protein
MRSHNNQRGVALLAVLLFVAVTSLAVVALVTFGAAVHRRQAEVALLDVGQELADALGSYRRMTPAGMPDQPARLDDLLLDTRFPGTVRHLRKVYADPITGSQRWGLYLDPQTGRIAGIHSLSDSAPQKRANFPFRLAPLEGKSIYSDWLFTAELSRRVDAKASQRRARGTFSPLDLIEPNTTPPRPTDQGDQTFSPLDLLER